MKVYLELYFIEFIYLAPIDPWKLYMSLKSGLLAESTWAIDALNILLYDDNTIAYFNLKHFPGLVNCLIEHFLKCLKLMFDEENGDEFSDLFVNEYSYDDEAEETVEQINTRPAKLVAIADCSSDESSGDDTDENINKRSKNNKKSSKSKQQNGFANQTNNNSQTVTTVRKPGRPKKNQTTTKQEALEEELSVTQTALSQYQIMKINFNDRDARKRFMHYYTVAKTCDSRLSDQWLEFNTQILEEQEQGARKVAKTSESLSRERKELNNHILTNLTSVDDLTSLKKLFYGPNFYEQIEKRQKTEEKEVSCEKDEPKTVNGLENTEKKDKNAEFISRHRTLDEPEKCLYNDQSMTDEEGIFKIVNSRKTELIQRISALSTIFRNLSFVPGNEIELCKYKLLLKILSRLLVLKEKSNLFDDKPANTKPTNSLLTRSKSEWWWQCVQFLRENTLVTIANISTYLNLDYQSEDVIELISHGLIHWTICPSSDAQDACHDSSLVSPQRLAIEALSKMTINDTNVDLILATMTNLKPYINMLISTLCTEFLARRDDETSREFSIVLLTAIAKCDQLAARTISKYTAYLLTFIEDFEEHTRRNNLLTSHMHQPVDSMTLSNISEEHLGTTVDMLRRCARCLSHLAAYEENAVTILKYENRILDLITSHFVDFKVAQTLSEVLFLCSLNKEKPGVVAGKKESPEFTYSFLNPNISPAF